MTLDKLVAYTQIFYYVLVGAAGFAGAFALVLDLWRRVRILWYRKKYRPQLDGKSFRLINIKDTAPIFVHDLKRKLKRHVANPATMEDLGFDWNSVRCVSREEYDSIPTGYPINTKRQLL